jgi:fatty acid desaturase
MAQKAPLVRLLLFALNHLPVATDEVPCSRHEDLVYRRVMSASIASPAARTAQGQPNADAVTGGARVSIMDDMAMIRAASELTRDLVAPRPAVYWADFLGSAFVGYAALYGAIAIGTIWLALGAALVSILALYRAGSFIHEVTHIKHSAVPGFRLGFNVVVGIPLLVPSFMYEGVHSLHHARTRYGTVDDPEYLPLALMKPWTVPLFVAVSSLAPIALLFRYGVLTPLSLLIPPLRTVVVERYSGLVINPQFRRRPAEGALRRIWQVQEAAACLWALALVTMVATGVFPIRAFLIALGITSGTLVLNQVRTLVAHLWENDGAVITTTAQFLDSVNVPPPNRLSGLWAPVGLRYHATHHLLPGLPYHALGEAHRRLREALPQDSQYHGASYTGLPVLVTRLVSGAAKA